MNKRKKNNRAVLPTLQPELDVNSNMFGGDLSKLSEEGRILVELVMGKLDGSVREILAKLDERDVRIASLEDEVRALKSDRDELSLRIDDIEARGRCDDVIVSGSALPSVSGGEDTAGVVSDVLRRELNYSLAAGDVSEAFRLGKKPVTQAVDRRNVLVRFHNSSGKSDLMKACRRVKPPGLFVNENLIPARSKIQYTLRRAKRHYGDKINAVGSTNGSVFVWVRAPDQQSRDLKMFINTTSRLRDFFEKSLGTTLSDFLSSDS